MNNPIHRSDAMNQDLTFSVEGARLFGGFMVRAVKRHKRLAVTTFLGTVVLAALALAVMPPTYRIQSRILTHTSYIIPALATPTRAIPWGAQSTTQGAVELIKSRANLAGIIDELRLSETWELTRTSIGRAVDAVHSAIFGELDYEEMRNALIAVLERRLMAHLEDDVIVLTIEWHDQTTALHILEVAQRRFLDGRRNTELSEINETIAILERSVSEARPAVDAAAERLKQVVASVSGRRGATRAPVIEERAPALTSSASSAAELAQVAALEADLRLKRETVARIETAYRERVRAAETALGQLRTSLGPNHPDVINATRNLEIASRPPDELAALKTEEARIAMQLNNRGVSTPRSTPLAASVMRSVAPMLSTPDPEIQQAAAELDRADRTLGDLLDRLEDARIEGQTARAAFNYRYFITQPPIFPRKKVRPKPPVVLGGGVFAALFLAVFVSIAADVSSGRIVESWQITRFVGLPVLGEVEEA